MRISFSESNMSCQPLRNFGRTPIPEKNEPKSTPNFSSNTVSKEEYDKLNAKYELACRLAVAQAEQYNKFVAAYKK